MSYFAQKTEGETLMRSSLSSNLASEVRIWLAHAPKFLAFACVAFLYCETAFADVCLPPDDEISRWSGDDDDDGVGSNDLMLVGNATAGVVGGIGASGHAFSFDGSGVYATTGSMTLSTAGSFVLWVRPSALSTGLNALAGTH